MSKRITTRTEINDHELAIQALKAAGYQYRTDDTRIHITSGPLAGVNIDTHTGRVDMDEDTHGADAVNPLKQIYGEMKIRAMITKEGGQIQEHSVNKQGEIVLVYSIG